MAAHDDKNTLTSSVCFACGKVSGGHFSTCLYCGQPLSSVISSVGRRGGVSRGGLMGSSVSKADKLPDREWQRCSESTVFEMTGADIGGKACSEQQSPVTVSKKTGNHKPSASNVTDISPINIQKKGQMVNIGKSQEIPPEFRPFVDKIEGKYRLLGNLGKGGMATIFHAKDLSLGREVAIKLLSAKLLRDSDLVKRFILEARTAAALEHPNIVRIHSISADKGACFIVMSHVPGGSLAKRLAKEKLSPETIVSIASEICSALQYAHEAGVVHRDIKPSNILFNENGNAVLADFGIARSLGTATMTAAGQVLGTPQYMSPEQALGKRVDARSDIYSLGAVLYEMCCGRPPFRADNAVSYMYKHVHEQPKAPSEIDPEIPDRLSDCIMTCLAKDPEKRFHRVQDIHSLLQKPQNRSLPVLVKQYQDEGITGKIISIFSRLLGLLINNYIRI